ncbi:MAG: ABC transporter six-transmembrane domain-containing protein [Chloroflexota bacterium]
MQTEYTITTPTITLWGIIHRFKRKISLTLLLVVAESLLDLLFPLFIGYSINGLLNQSYAGIAALGGLGVLTLLVGSGRRFYDTRAYAGMYTSLSTEMVSREQEKKNSISMISARASLLTEFVEFLENSMPSIITSVIGLVGILVILFTLNLYVFWASVALFALMAVVYLLSGRWNFSYNKSYNDELENQVNALSTHDMGVIGRHFKTVMHWNIKLSDLETINYALIWLGIIGLLVYAPIAVIGNGVTDYGLVFSVLMYVFQYVESVVSLPFFIQQVIRLQEISGRLGE